MFRIVCSNKKKLSENYKRVTPSKITTDVKKELSLCLFDMSKNKQFEEFVAVETVKNLEFCLFSIQNVNKHRARSSCLHKKNCELCITRL